MSGHPDRGPTEPGAAPLQQDLHADGRAQERLLVAGQVHLQAGAQDGQRGGGEVPLRQQDAAQHQDRAGAGGAGDRLLQAVLPVVGRQPPPRRHQPRPRLQVSARGRVRGPDQGGRQARLEHQDAAPEDGGQDREERARHHRIHAQGGRGQQLLNMILGQLCQ